MTVYKVDGGRWRVQLYVDGVRESLGVYESEEMARLVEANARDALSSGKPKRKRATMSRRLRFRVLERDGFRCVYCGAGSDVAELHVDHVEPVARGGSDAVDNLVTACSECNLGKSARAIDPGHGAHRVHWGGKLYICTSADEAREVRRKLAAGESPHGPKYSPPAPTPEET